jgi:hypothetical protein
MFDAFYILLGKIHLFLLYLFSSIYDCQKVPDNILRSVKIYIYLRFTGNLFQVFGFEKCYMNSLLYF